MPVKGKFSGICLEKNALSPNFIRIKKSSLCSDDYP
jgi:hypothetical protein